MSAPTYRDRVDGTIVQAIQFIKDDPRTHWHVNLGHPVAKALQDKYWVMTDEGPAEVADRDFVVLSDRTGERPNATGLRIVKEAEFTARFDPVIAVERRDGTRLVYTLQPGETWAMLDDNLIISHPDRAPLIIYPDGTAKEIELKSPIMVEPTA